MSLSLATHSISEKLTEFSKGSTGKKIAISLVGGILTLPLTIPILILSAIISAPFAISGAFKSHEYGLLSSPEISRAWLSSRMPTDRDKAEAAAWRRRKRRVF